MSPLGYMMKLKYLCCRNQIVKIKFICIKIESRCRPAVSVELMCVYVSRQNDEVGFIEIFICFNLRHMSAIYLEIRKQDNEFVKGNRDCTLLLAFISFLLRGLQQYHLILLH
jgi:hypothetical protein